MKSRPFAFSLLLSFSAHLLLFTGLLFAGLLELAPPQKAVYVRTAKVDLVALPDLPSPPDLQKKPKPAVLKKKPPKKPPAAKPPEEKQAKTAKPPQNKKPAFDPPAQTERPKEKAPNKGNRLSKGMDTEGETAAEEYTEEQKQALAAYLNVITRQIKSYWDLPNYLMDENLFAELEVKVSDQGEVVEKSLVTSSLNDLFDRQVLAAIEKAAPFPPPPEETKKIISDGIVFGLSSKETASP